MTQEQQQEDTITALLGLLAAALVVLKRHEKDLNELEKAITSAGQRLVDRLHA